MRTVASEFARLLRNAGIQYIFGVPSGNMIDYIEEIRKTDGMEFIHTSHESTAAFMASAVGRLTGKPGACFGTFGPGATNLSTGVGCAFLDRNPLLAFTDEMPENLRSRTVQMNINHQALFRPITKWTTRLDPMRMDVIIPESVNLAFTGIPGPVHIGIPAGIGQSEILNPLGNSTITFREKKIISERIINKAVSEAGVQLSKATRPVIAVGLDAVRAGIAREIKILAEKLQVPVVLTPMAKGIFPESHPLYAGVLFHALSDRVAKTYSQADLVIGIGYDPVEFNYEDWMPDALLMQINTYPADVDEKKIPHILNVIGDIGNTIRSVLTFDATNYKWNLDGLEERKIAMLRELEPPENSFGPRTIISELRKALPKEGILSVDVGAHLHLAGQQWLTPSPEKLLITNGWSSMGFAIPAAMSAKLLNPALPVACLMGDGGFRMMAGELATAGRLNLSVVFIVILDGSLSLIDIKQNKKRYNREYGTRLQEKTYPSSGNFFGVPVIRAKDQTTYKNALKKAFATKGPVLIEAVADGSEYEDFVLRPNK